MHDSRSCFFQDSRFFSGAVSIGGRYAAVCGFGKIIFVSKSYANGNIDQADRDVAEVTAAGVRINDHKSSKREQHDHVTAKQKNPIHGRSLFL